MIGSGFELALLFVGVVTRSMLAAFARKQARSLGLGCKRGVQLFSLRPTRWRTMPPKPPRRSWPASDSFSSADVAVVHFRRAGSDEAAGIEITCGGLPLTCRPPRISIPAGLRRVPAEARVLQGVYH